MGDAVPDVELDGLGIDKDHVQFLGSVVGQEPCQQRVEKGRLARSRLTADQDVGGAQQRQPQVSLSTSSVLFGVENWSRQTFS